MLLFGHIGITVGVARAFEVFGSVKTPPEAHRLASVSSPGIASGNRGLGPHYLLKWVGNPIGPVDYRFVLLGSLLPDILDKPLWLFTFSDAFHSGRGYEHTLLFNLVLFAGALILIKYRKSWLLVLSLSSFTHLVLDQMWNNPIVLWWPLLGSFPKVSTAGWISDIIRRLPFDPYTYIGEIVGLIIVLSLSYRLVVRRNVGNFIRTGAID